MLEKKERESVHLPSNHPSGTHLPFSHIIDPCPFDPFQIGHFFIDILL